LVKPHSLFLELLNGGDRNYLFSDFILIMDLLEYQAKELFHQVGIPVLPSQTIADPGELKRLQIPYPVVLKSQVRSGGRGKAGGVRFVENTIDAIAAARAIFNLRIMGEYPEVLLAEARYDAQREFFLAVLLDYQLQRPVLLGSSRGGMDLDTLLEQMQKVVIEEEFSPFYARRLAIKMGLQGELIHSVSTIIEKMYCLFEENDLDLIEINPLGISANGELMALDSKISVNDNAVPRHPELTKLSVSKRSALERFQSELELASTEKVSEPRWLGGIDEKGNIGIISNSVGLALATWDAIVQDKGKPCGCLAIGETISGKCLSDLSLLEELKEALERIVEVKGLKVVLVNLLGTPDIIESLGNAIADYLRGANNTNPTPKGEERATRATGTSSFEQRSRNSTSRSRGVQTNEPIQYVLRLGGGDLESLEERLSAISVDWTDDLEIAVTQALSLAKSK
jgi:succinyl-CoA synthetase beta subunit